MGFFGSGRWGRERLSAEDQRRCLRRFQASQSDLLQLWRVPFFLFPLFSIQGYMLLPALQTTNGSPIFTMLYVPTLPIRALSTIPCIHFNIGKYFEGILGIQTMLFHSYPGFDSLFTLCSRIPKFPNIRR